MKIDLSRCQTPAEIDRAMRPITDLIVRVGRLIGGEVRVTVDARLAVVGERPRRKVKPRRGGGPTP